MKNLFKLTLPMGILVSMAVLGLVVVTALQTTTGVEAGGKQGGEGCTPGYWKQMHHFDSWPAPITPSTPFSDYFEDAFPGLTMLDVLELKGGGLNALGRHTVAALLNATSPDVSYDLTQMEVIDMFDAAFPGTKNEYNALKDIFEGFNEQGCPLN